jgi:hypothetical protein
MKKQESSPPIVYISIDFECVHSGPLENLPVINFGAVAYSDTKEFISGFSVNLKSGKPDEDTLNWWTTKNQEAYRECTKEPVLYPEDGMKNFEEWVRKIATKGKIMFVCYPAIYDGSFLYFYWLKFLGHPTNGKGVGFTVLDIRSYAFGKLGIPYKDCNKQTSLKKYCPLEEDFPHTHTGYDDAMEQMMLFFNIRDSK